MKRVLLGILLAVVIAGAGYAGWQMWQDKQETKNTNTTQQNPTKDPSEGGKYFVIKEWSVRFELPEKAKGDLTYTVGMSNGFENVVFDSSLTELTNCAPISLTRSEAEISDQKVGKYYFGIVTGPAACDTQDSPRQQKAFKTQQELKNVLSRLEAVN